MSAMQPADLRFRPDAQEDLHRLFLYLTSVGVLPETARRYIDRIADRCLTLCLAPKQGRPRPDLGTEVRTMAYERRILIVYTVAQKHVEIVRIFRYGQDIAAILRANRPAL
ncbi:MAG: type II toxin-antitoxin system RelE/ParE family toxin [Gemmatimonadaceae bacterium]|nr:type II toxin-antitoxin system RelE/ParE family toxin [Acetobacteraceae bacterium]